MLGKDTFSPPNARNHTPHGQAREMKVENLKSDQQVLVEI